MKKIHFLNLILILAPIWFIYLGYFIVVGIGLWILIYIYYAIQRDVEWYFKVIVPVLAYALLYSMI